MRLAVVQTVAHRFYLMAVRDEDDAEILARGIGDDTGLFECRWLTTRNIKISSELAAWIIAKHGAAYSPTGRDG